jgi:hypothetical protein
MADVEADVEAALELPDDLVTSSDEEQGAGGGPRPRSSSFPPGTASTRRRAAREARRIGARRWRPYEQNKRSHRFSAQMKAMVRDAVRIAVTTSCFVAMFFIPCSGRLREFATGMTPVQFLQVYDGMQNWSRIHRSRVELDFTAIQRDFAIGGSWLNDAVQRLAALGVERPLLERFHTVFRSSIPRYFGGAEGMVKDLSVRRAATTARLLLACLFSMPSARRALHPCCILLHQARFSSVISELTNDLDHYDDYAVNIRVAGVQQPPVMQQPVGDGSDAKMEDDDEDAIFDVDNDEYDEDDDDDGIIADPDTAMASRTGTTTIGVSQSASAAGAASAAAPVAAPGATPAAAPGAPPAVTPRPPLLFFSYDTPLPVLSDALDKAMKRIKKKQYDPTTLRQAAEAQELLLPLKAAALAQMESGAAAYAAASGGSDPTGAASMQMRPAGSVAADLAGEHVAARAQQRGLLGLRPH